MLVALAQLLGHLDVQQAALGHQVCRDDESYAVVPLDARVDEATNIFDLAFPRLDEEGMIHHQGREDPAFLESIPVEFRLLGAITPSNQRVIGRHGSSESGFRLLLTPSRETATQCHSTLIIYPIVEEVKRIVFARNEMTKPLNLWKILLHHLADQNDS